MPANDGGRFDDDEDVGPAFELLFQNDPEGTVDVCRHRFWALALIHRQLLTQSEVFDREIGPGHCQRADGSEHDLHGESEK